MPKLIQVARKSTGGTAPRVKLPMKRMPEPSSDDDQDILAELSDSEFLSDTSNPELTQEASHPRISPPPMTGVQAVTLDSWGGEGPDDLSFRAGEIIEITSEAEEYWWFGRNRAGKEGGFPPVYVKKIFHGDD
ncbi:hypothetical protein BKA82DRAFT_181695 [Pisolithus tinctorius]|uniref:SH3 domain-containing protein n=1 Tax=Pisolithus tinctorius Marx 270 TaxID=870435 RepID=A0A0C3KYT0_PISTI|nr:hypothetical protein BKA82DRAFT_181695 [Pisolithus tinctorius]KIO14677.1 hypothetical protein M404DRAFT_181695 [Pisolithus tinctorius Marx 270]